MDFVTQPFKINDVLLWYERKELILSPKFQRRAVWKPKGKSNLIDSIIRGFPLPPFFIREELSLKERRTIREVIDGQQRIRTIMEFIAGEFTMQKIHNEQYARIKFNDLPDEIQTKFLTYILTINVVGQITDKEVYEMFSRLNSYSVPLNQPERANALYTGVFKQKIDELAKTYLAFWTSANIFTDNNIARMLEIQLTAELVAVMLKGITDGKNAIYNKKDGLYRVYDDSFEYAEECSRRFEFTISLISKILGEDLQNTELRRPPIFYSIFSAIYDIVFGFPIYQESETIIPRLSDSREKPKLNDSSLDMVKNDLLELNEALAGATKTNDSEDEGDEIEEESEIIQEIPFQFEAFVEASRSSTDKIMQRKTRHFVLTEILKPAFE